jgi:hypothetical protein
LQEKSGIGHLAEIARRIQAANVELYTHLKNCEGTHGLMSGFFCNARGWKTDRISEYERTIMRETASQLQLFLDFNKGPGIFLRVRQTAVYALATSLTDVT